MEKYIDKELSQKILVVGQKFKLDTPNGGMASVLASYDKYFYHMRHIATWKYTNKVNKLWYPLYHYIYFLLLLLFDRRIRIVHIHAAAYASFTRTMFFARAAKRLKKQVILHEHAADFDQYYEQSRQKEKIIKAINNCDRLIVLSSSWKDFFLKVGVEESKIVILNNIVTPPEKLEKRSVSLPVRFLFLGWLGKRKGIWDLLKVITDHKAELKGRFILRFGGNDFEEEIKSYIAANRIDSLVKFEGWVSGRKKEECLAWADVFILPSYNEGLPISLLEAMSYGLPLISTNVGGIPEILKDRQNGIMVHPGNESEIWNAVKYFIDNPAEIAKMGNTSETMVAPYTPQNVFHNLKSIYNNLLDEKQ